jgi:tetratricopeptide (TPR) repeat protein
LGEPKNYRAIMLSSTFTDLSEHRQRAIEAISKLDYMPKVMEHTGARADDDVIESSLNMVRDSTAYVGVISLKYGQTPFDPDRNPGRLSITELEFNEAMQLDRPIVLFVMGDDHLVKRADVETDPDKRIKLDDFRERAKRMRNGREAQRVYEEFESLEGFSTAAAIAIGNLVRYLERSLPESKNPGQASRRAITNVPINVPRHFVGRDEDLAAIDAALKSRDGRVAIHGLRGVGKTTLAAAYAEQHRDDYRATWWIRAESESTISADLVGLGVRLGWVSRAEKEEIALATVLDQLRNQGEGVLLIYDNATKAAALRKFLLHGSKAQIIVSSNAPGWRDVAEPVEIEVWPKDIGADYLVERTGRIEERDTALLLSGALGGLPLAHAQAAAYCEDVGIALRDYRGRFEAATMEFLEDPAYAPVDYHPERASEQKDRLTVASTFRLAIEQAAERHPAAQPLIVHAALLVPEPIPLFLFSEAREKFGGTFSASLAKDGLDKAVAALRAVALVDREAIPDERDSAITTDCVRLHRLVWQVARAQCEGEARADIQRALIEALTAVYPAETLSDPKSWPRARRLDALATALIGDDKTLQGAERSACILLDRLAFFKQGFLAAYAEARPLFERALAIREKVLGLDHPDTARSHNNLGDLLNAQGHPGRALPCYERALAIRKKAFGLNHADTAESLNNIGYQLQAKGDFAGARSYYDQALSIRETVLGRDHPATALSLNNIGYLLRAQRKLAGARGYYERALVIKETALGPDHPGTALSQNNLGYLLLLQGDFAGARSLFEKAVSSYQKALGPDHPDTARVLDNLGVVLRKQDDIEGALPKCEEALAILDRALGSEHPDTLACARNVENILGELGRTDEAHTLSERYGIGWTRFGRMSKWLSQMVAS